ncbi:MAG: transcription termination factor Rho, transcription termination factor Rho [Chloroflexi bacterium CSP1-4]|nr:MAG: transcription termination factor Rho, transcription termination factor Rho [Chloroflexi bacterium CSP1-4]
MNINELKEKNLRELVEIGGDLDVADARDMRKDDLVERILQRQVERGGQVYATGILDIVDEGFGFMRRHGLMPSQDDVYVSSSQVRRFGLRPGDRVGGVIRAPKDGEKYWGLLRVESVNGVDPETAKRRPHFDVLTPIHPIELINLETDSKNLSQRLINLVNPLGKGQRALIVSPPKAGKTMLLKQIANGITANYPEILLMVALIGERPEEVTDMRRSVKGEVISSTFDEPTENHTHVAEMCLEIAKRQVETGRDVVILLDSITRLARAYNLALPPSGRTLSGGIDPIALYPPKRFFGAARKIEEGGSLTIIGTCLIDTGSRMDDVIYEEFKGTGNSELILDRKLAEKRSSRPSTCSARAPAARSSSSRRARSRWSGRCAGCCRPWARTRASSCSSTASPRPSRTQPSWPASRRARPRPRLDRELTVGGAIDGPRAPLVRSAGNGTFAGDH